MIVRRELLRCRKFVLFVCWWDSIHKAREQKTTIIIFPFSRLMLYAPSRAQFLFHSFSFAFRLIHLGICQRDRKSLFDFCFPPSRHAEGQSHLCLSSWRRQRYSGLCVRRCVNRDIAIVYAHSEIVPIWQSVAVSKLIVIEKCRNNFCFYSYAHVKCLEHRKLVLWNDASIWKWKYYTHTNDGGQKEEINQKNGSNSSCYWIEIGKKKREKQRWKEIIHDHTTDPHLPEKSIWPKNYYLSFSYGNQERIYAIETIISFCSCWGRFVTVAIIRPDIRSTIRETLRKRKRERMR